MQPRLCRQVTIQDNLPSNSEIIEIEEGTNDLSQAELNDYVDSYTQQDLNYVDSDEDQQSSSEDGGVDLMQMEDLSQRTNDLRIQDDVNAHAHSHNHAHANANVPKFTYYENQGASLITEEEEDEKQRKKQGTLTQSGFHRPKSDRLSISARKRKKAKIEKQTNTLTQNFERETKNKTSPPKDTKDRVYYNRINSARGTCYVFNVGESFRINCKDYPDCIAVIQSFGNKKMKKNAACIVYQKIKSTFAGNVKNIEPFREFVQETNAKLNPEIFVQYKNQKTIRLKYLNEIVKDFTPPSPRSFIEYDMILGEETASFRTAGQGHGFTVVYKHIQKAAKEEKTTTDTMEIECKKVSDEDLKFTMLFPAANKNPYKKSTAIANPYVKSTRSAVKNPYAKTNKVANPYAKTNKVANPYAKKVVNPYAKSTSTSSTSNPYAKKLSASNGNLVNKGSVSKLATSMGNKRKVENENAETVLKFVGNSAEKKTAEPFRMINASPINSRYKHIQNRVEEEKTSTDIEKVFSDEHLLTFDLTPKKTKNKNAESAHQLVVKSVQEMIAKLSKMNMSSSTDSALLKELQCGVQTIIAKADSERKILPKKKSQKYTTTCNEDSDKIKVLDVFAGMGGMSQGFEKAGFDVQWAVENCTTAAGTLKINHRNTFVFEEDVQAWFQKMENILDSTKRKKGNESNPYAQVLMFAKHAHFSPPCQAFSDANSVGGRNDALNASLTLLCIKIIKMLYSCGNLKSASMENVTGLLNRGRGHEEYLKTYVSSLVGLGMDVRVSILDSSRYGDPQYRSRVFVTAVKTDLVLNEFPVATHGGDKKDKNGNMLPGVVTCSDALGDLEKVTPVSGNGLVELQREDGTSYFVKDHASSGTGLKSDMVQLKRDEPSNTIIRKSNVKHYSLHRTLTLREQARLQSLPDDFEFNGARGLIISGIGNAVPVLTSTEVAKSIKSSYR